LINVKEGGVWSEGGKRQYTHKCNYHGKQKRQLSLLITNKMATSKDAPQLKLKSNTKRIAAAAPAPATSQAPATPTTITTATTNANVFG